ncbi:MAG: hypothetical protein FJ395_08800, partial [Verrucomicrobia bacterium]|nr:hypothetical protein [Verrucomicrobiota bacterium]
PVPAASGLVLMMCSWSSHGWWFVRRGWGAVHAPMIVAVSRCAHGTLSVSSLGISNGNAVAGSGTITGGVANWGTLSADGGTLSVAGNVVSYGTLRAVNGGVAEFFGTVFNLGTADFAGGSLVVHGSYQNVTDTTNAWIDAGNGLWREDARWSLGVAPTNTQSYLVIANANTKTVTVDSQTPVLAPWTLTNWFVMVSAPDGSTNTLSVETPSWAMVNVVVGPGGRLSIGGVTLTAGAGGFGTLEVDGELAINTGTLDGTVVPVTLGGNGTATVSFAGGVLLTKNYQIGAATTGGVVIATGNGLWRQQGNFLVGTNTSGNSLLIAGGAQLANVVGYIAYTTDSSNNTVTVTGPGSIWTNSAGFVVGRYGPGNTLVVTNGGAVFSDDGYVGQYTNANDNVVSISDSGSVWRINGKLYLGFEGANNTVIITNQGQVFCSSDGVIGRDNDNNRMIVTGSGSLWNISGTWFHVGYAGSGNMLTIANGGAVNSAICYLGYTNGANNNAVIIAGTGSIWTTTSDLFIGRYGSGNSLTISNGGVANTSVAWIGRYESSSNNVALVTDPGSLWNLPANSVRMNGTSNQLTISNGAVVQDLHGYIGYDGGTGGNLVLVTDSGSVWSNASNLFVGSNNSRGNQLTVTNGALVLSGSARIGSSSTSSNNAALVTGAGSIWSNSANFYVGYIGTSNQLTVSNGALVQSLNGFIGSEAASVNNRALITGSGSAWDNSGNFNVGNIGSGNTLIIAEGGTLFDTVGRLGNQLGSNSNTVFVVGSGSVWSNRSILYVGNDGANNALVITNGGVVFNTDGFIGSNTTANGNSAFVTGNGSIWTNAGNLYVGNNGADNTLIIADNGRVFANNLIIGNGANNATVNLLGGSLSIANLLTVQKNAMLSGNGTISGSVLVNGTVLAGTGIGLAFTGSVTNNGSIVATNGATIVFDAGVVNNGLLYARGGSLVFNDGFTNNGIINSNDTIIAFFTANPTNGGMPLAVSFTDLSVGAITNRNWNFGDGSDTNITDTAITHTYDGIGTNTVRLIVSSADGVSTNSRTIIVGPPVTSTWISASASGNWSDISKWSPSWVPDNAATVIFGNSGSTCIVDSVSRTVSNLVFNRNASFFVAASGGAQLSILNGITVLSNRTYTLTAPVVLAGTNTWAINNGTLTAAGIITGDNPLSITGPGTVNLSVSNAYTGDTILNSGKVILAAGATIGSGVLYLNGGQIRSAANTNTVIANTAVLLADTTILSGGSNLIFAGTVFLTNGSRTLTINSDTVISGQITDNGIGNGLTRLGSRILTLTASNTYSGATVVNAGQLLVSNRFALGVSGIATAGFGGAHGFLNLADGVTISGVTLYNFNAAAGLHGGLQVHSGSATWGGPIVICVNGARISGGTSGGTLTISGPITDNGNNFRVLFRAGTIILTNTNNNWGGSTVFSEGRFFLGANNVLPTNTTVNLNEPGTVTLDMAGFDQQIAGLIHGSATSAGILTNSGMALSTLTLNVPAGTNSEYNAHIRGNIAIVKTGPGTFTLSGTNLYTGFTRIDEGTLALGGNATLTNSPTITIASGGRLDVTGRTGGGMTLVASQTMRGGGIFNGNLFNQGVIIAEVASGQFAFTGTVTNNGTMYATNGATLAFYGPVVNNGVIDVIYGNTNFFFTFINNGILLTAGGDNDGDGMSNLKESQAGTIPTNSASRLRVVSMAREGDDIRITWTAVGGKSYVVQTNSVPGTGFADFNPVIYVPGVGESVTNHVHTGGATNASSFFYRIRLGP